MESGACGHCRLQGGAGENFGKAFGKFLEYFYMLPHPGRWLRYAADAPEAARPKAPA